MNNRTRLFLYFFHLSLLFSTIVYGADPKKNADTLTHEANGTWVGQLPNSDCTTELKPTPQMPKGPDIERQIPTTASQPRSKNIGGFVGLVINAVKWIMSPSKKELAREREIANLNKQLERDMKGRFGKGIHAIGGNWQLLDPNMVDSPSKPILGFTQTQKVTVEPVNAPLSNQPIDSTSVASTPPTPTPTSVPTPISIPAPAPTPSATSVTIAEVIAPLIEAPVTAPIPVTPPIVEFTSPSTPAAALTPAKITNAALLKKFPSSRLTNSPLSETAISENGGNTALNGLGGAAMAGAALAQAAAESGAAATAASTTGAAASGTSLTATAMAMGGTALLIGAHVFFIGMTVYMIGEGIASLFASTPNSTDPKTPHIPNMGNNNNPNPKKPDDDKKKIPEAAAGAKKLADEIIEEAKKKGWTNPDMPALDDAQQINHVFPKNKPDHDPFSLEAYQEMQELVRDPKNFLGTDKHGNQWFSKIIENGQEKWAKAYGSKVKSGGTSKKPGFYDAELGLIKENSPAYREFAIREAKKLAKKEPL